MDRFQLKTEYQPAGDQPQAIRTLCDGIQRGEKDLTLLGVTGSGKTFTIANLVAEFNRPTLVISHNKTLAAQLYNEFREFFPQNAVEYFVSYYDYYQPEAYVPTTDTYIEKDSSINDEINRMRLAATASLFEREDVLIVASVSSIYGLGDPEIYRQMLLQLERGVTIDRQELLQRLVAIQYTRNDTTPEPGTFRVKGDTVDIFPAYRQAYVRVELFGDDIERLQTVDPLTGETTGDMPKVAIYPAKHFVTPRDKIDRAAAAIEAELAEQVATLKRQKKLLEAQRLESRTQYDLEMIREIGTCSGVENYSRHFSGRAPGERPHTLFDYFPDNFILIVDESHVTLPQVRGMLAGDRARKQSLVDFGFRLPSALDNRPMSFDEFRSASNISVFVSATPADFERAHSPVIAEQLIRPTGLVDPEIIVVPIKGQIDRLLAEINATTQAGGRTLITTLTKKMAEDLSDYLAERGVKVRYLHSNIDTIERVEIVTDLRRGEFDALVGINLLREGLDIPEVSFIAILDADKSGFLRTETSLIQTIGRAARHVDGRVMLFADEITPAMRSAIDETERRRAVQTAYNEKHGITPQTIRKAIKQNIVREHPETEQPADTYRSIQAINSHNLARKERKAMTKKLHREMLKAARALDFEKAAVLRDKVRELEASE